MIKIEINTEYIKLGQFLKFCGIIMGGSEAKDFLIDNKIMVNNEQENRRGKKLYHNDIVEINNKKYQIEVRDVC